MLASIARSAAVAALAVPLLTLAAPSASAAEPAASAPAQPAALQNIDAPYISITICLHIPTPGSATLDWCWP
ncbi:hypothetical protein ACFRAQ_25545 [Nocardia sp. NPDC056611]|uniref:hypothetical protein n=1 Tax=Nocardia sp. NPDC056611 TaxID=3345877 RepID=UPI003670A22A